MALKTMTLEDVLNPPAETRTGVTFADLLAMEPTDYLYGIFGGELVVYSAPDTPNAAVVDELSDVLHEAKRAGYGFSRTAPYTVAFDYAQHGMRAQDVTQPDLFFVVAARRHIFGRRCLTDRPDLVIEVLSPTTKQDDLRGGRKFAIYERYGVPYYWVADPYAHTVVVFTLREGRYGEPVVLGEGETLACPLFPGLSWPLERLFAGTMEIEEE
jgi:Uma2 family endonuclease